MNTMKQKLKDAVKNKDQRFNKNSEFEFCKVCRLNHDQGQRHKFFPKHKKSLADFLSRFQTKIADVRFFLKNPSVLRPEHACRNRFWCVFCDMDIDEIGSSFACANAITHLASEDHVTKLKHFLWKNGGGMDRVDTFRILDADVIKWEKKCKSLNDEAASSSNGFQGLQVEPSNDIQHELKYENTNNDEINTFDPLKSKFSNDVMPLQYFTNEYQISHSGISMYTNVGSFVHDALLPMDACSHKDSDYLTSSWKSQNSNIWNNERLYQVYQRQRNVHGVSSSQGLQNITQISMAPENTGENVHTGPPPPWFDESEESQLNVQPKPVSCNFVSLPNMPGKSHKLNPKRVGAAWAEKRKVELEMEKRGEIASGCDANWLPNFGRVWQSGSRNESRKEFEKEKHKLPKVESLSEMPITIQPYISKRMRGMQMDTGCRGNE